MKFFRREAIHFVHAEDHVRYKYIERSLGLNHDEKLEINANKLGATQFEEYALVHPDVPRICFIQVQVFNQTFGMVITILVQYIEFGKKNVCCIIY